ncbi:Unannotated, partial [Lentimonas sp. CC19]
TTPHTTKTLRNHHKAPTFSNNRAHLHIRGLREQSPYKKKNHKKMKPRPIRKTDNLRIGRVSIPHARYFMTLCTESRKTNLTNPLTATSILNTWRAQHSTHDFTFHCATIMPDHIHWLCTLGTKLTLAQIISKFKTKTKGAMEQAKLTWQRNYHDHRLRADDAMEPFSKYIFLNPYRKQLLTISQTWPHWRLSRDYKPEFTLALNSNQGPRPEWLSETPTLQEIIDNDVNHQPPKT